MRYKVLNKGLQNYKGILLCPSVIKQMRRNEERLIAAGYKESKKKPLLFRNPTDKCVFFADMRGTEIVPIWDDTSPLFYAFKFRRNYPNWEKRRILKHEMERLAKYECHVRLSFYDEGEPDGLMFNSEEDGYCKWCGNDFRDSGLYCSKECTLRAKESHFETFFYNFNAVCETCGKMILDRKYMDSEFEAIFNHHPDLKKRFIISPIIEHHINYAEDITMIVCSYCHNKIHHSNDEKYTKYKPVDPRPEHQPKTKLVPCTYKGCKDKARVPFDASKKEIENAVCSKCRRILRRYPYSPI